MYASANRDEKINSWIIGPLRQASGSYQLPVLLLVAILGAAALLVAAIAVMSSRREAVMQVT
ncbi:MAG TPA: hypothetical protein VFV95_17860 [Vicinamibacterales bacterium]|nr:hypothetical protein [Vicinamibacterales bacterium]